MDTVSRSPVDVTDDLLEDWPLPQPDASGKEARGRVLVIAGSAELPGAARLAGDAALRAGAGKLALATVASAAAQLAMAIPEARVVALPETAKGGIAPPAIELAQEPASRADAIVIGPGMQDEDATCGLVRALLRSGVEAPIVLDACAINAVRDRGKSGAPVLITPHAGEMAHLLGRSKDDVERDPAKWAREAARQWQATVALKGAVTFIAAPDGKLWRHEGGNVGLGTSGSGDVLAGLIGGLAARGAPLEQAAAWGVRLHARAGERLAARLGTLGYLPRELAFEVPQLLEQLTPRKRRTIGFG
jgi:hydroxyethylthiazole kinase-like uncharacterized protein yjeF